VAVKVIHMMALDGDLAAAMRQEFLHECAVLKSLNTGPNILQFQARAAATLNPDSWQPCYGAPRLFWDSPLGQSFWLPPRPGCGLLVSGGLPHATSSTIWSLQPSDEECVAQRKPNCLQGACLDDDHMMLVTELCAGGNLSTAIHRRAVTWHKRCGCTPARLLRWRCHGSEILYARCRPCCGSSLLPSTTSEHSCQVSERTLKTAACRHAGDTASHWGARRACTSCT